MPEGAYRVRVRISPRSGTDRAENIMMNEAVDWREWMRGLGRPLRRVREFLGLSQDQVARLAGGSQGAVSRLEAGRRPPPPPMGVPEGYPGAEPPAPPLRPPLPPHR